MISWLADGTVSLTRTLLHGICWWWVSRRSKYSDPPKNNLSTEGTRLYRIILDAGVPKSWGHIAVANDFLRWRLIFVDRQYGTCLFALPVRRILGYWTIFFFYKMCAPLSYQIRSSESNFGAGTKMCTAKCRRRQVGLSLMVWYICMNHMDESFELPWRYAE
jgi:hypothetical protein